MTSDPNPLALLRSFCFPLGEDAARSVRAVRTTQRGEMRISQAAHWTSFTATETIEAARTAFRWEARIANKVGFLGVTDAYEEGRGRLVAKLGGVIPVKKLTGLDVDKGELQRYLAEVVMCPPMLLSNPALRWTAVGPHTLRVRDKNDTSATFVDIDMGEDGSPSVCRAERPRIVGNKVILTPWSGATCEFEEREGMRVATKMESRWHLPEGSFTAIRIELTSFEVLR